MGGRRANLALLGLLAIAFLTGWVAFALSGQPSRWTLILHSAAGVGLLLLVPWKSIVVKRALPRRRRGWWASIALTALLLVSLTAGFLHSLGRPWLPGDLTAMEFHVGAALVLVPFAIWHVLDRPQRLRRTDLGRRNLLRAGLLAGAATASALVLPGARRGPTGSYRLDFVPGTQWMFDAVPKIDLASWTLEMGARHWTHEELARFDDQVIAVIDCTGGWYSEQRWEGVLVSRLLKPGPDARSIVVRSQTGYWRRYPIEELPRLLLATRIGGEPLAPANGHPVRLVAPGRRGYEWVKWVSSIEVDDLPAWWQPPFPTQ